MYSQLPVTPAPASAGALGHACFHCGEPCPDPGLALAEKSFCCLGCQTVFSLLNEHGLDQFYQLQNNPGTRVQNAAQASPWAFLDDPAVQAKLVDYADAGQVRVTLHLPAIHCVACVWLLENLFKLHPGVGRSTVNFSRREAAIAFAPDKIKFSELAGLLSSIGYEPLLTLGETEKAKGSPLGKRTWLQIGFAAFGFGNIMLMSLPFYLGLDSFNGPWFKAMAGWLGLSLTLPVVTFSAADFWLTAWASVRQRVLTMEVPIALGLGAIYGASVFEVLSHRGPGYCDSLCGLIFFLLCGRLFQRKTYDRLTFDRDYKGFFPLSILRKTAVGEESIAISRLEPGDQILLRHGELLPADARLLSGPACMDYSFVTGEAEPVACDIGGHLYAGGRQVGGLIVAVTVKPVAQSYLASLWNHEAFRKPRCDDLDSLTNRYSRRFTRMVIGVALAAAAFWLYRDSAKALKAFTSVLIVACPCALALAAPLTHGTAQRLLARLKIFLKNAQVIERLAEVDTIVFDKTGTLTTGGGGAEFIKAESGKRKAESYLAAEGQRWIGSLARYSTHPSAVRIARALGPAALPVAHYKETPGCGIEGEIDGHRLLLGSRVWLAQRGVSVGDFQTDAANAARTGSRVFAAVDGVLLGGFVLENSLRPEVRELIGQLGGRFELVLLSGDNDREAGRFGALLGERAELRFNQSPADKLNFIRDLQLRGRKVLMVGDGLNDAGALKQAEVGVALVEQVGIFSPASDIILDAAELPRLARVLEFARHSTKVVRAAFVLSSGYNVVGVSIAAAGLLSPIVCAVLMPLSSATVVAFTCGAIAWAGRRLQLEKVPSAKAVLVPLHPSPFNLQPSPKGTA